VLAPWRWTQRRTDLAILWPQCKRLSPNLDKAKAAFAVHAFHDRAWMCLGEAEIVRRIEALK
jgi:hypothetical protein